MGCGGSKGSAPVQNTRGWVPKKLNPKDVLGEPLDEQFIAGNGSILKFDIKSMTLSQVKLPEGVKIDDRCAAIMSNSLDGEKRHLFYVAGGNDDFKSFSDNFYAFDIKDPTKPITLPKLPKPVSHHNLVQTQDGKTLYLIGGLYEKTKISADIYKYEIASQKWEKVAKSLPKPRANFETIVNGSRIYIFAGDSGEKMPSTQIEYFDTKTGEIVSLAERLPIGVSGASIALFNRDVLLIGGDRLGQRSTGVVMLDLKDKTILSLRDLKKPRSNAIVLNTKFDEMIAIGGSGDKSVEKRHWCDKSNDYIWSDCTKDIKGLEVLGNPDEYSGVQSTINISLSFDDEPQKLNPTSNFIFGNDFSPFLLEFTKTMETSFFPAPLTLQQKTGQYAFRRSNEKIIFIGGTDQSYSLYSNKIYELDIPTSKVSQIGKLNVGRTGFTVNQVGDHLFIIGGQTKNLEHLNSVERLNVTNAKDCKLMEPMAKLRSGHISWTSPDNKKIFVAGGRSKKGEAPLSCCEVYDVDTKKWTVHKTSLSVPIHGAKTLNHKDGKTLLVFGGATGAVGLDSAVSEVRSIDRANFNGFDPKPVFSMSQKRYKPFVILGGNEDTIIVIGGSKSPILEVFNYTDHKPIDAKKLKTVNDTVFVNLPMITDDFTLTHFSGC